MSAVLRRWVPWSTGKPQAVAMLCIALLGWNHAEFAVAREFAIDIKETSIEELMQTSVTTVSRRAQDWQTAAAAVHVLTREDIRRAHVTSVPDALRLVPGVQVARVDANKWAVTIRGFNDRLANKLLVLVDGRSIYDPLFAGTFWEARDVVLEEIERIEVVRGPGGTLWGSNAVNGVINIITRHAAETEGAHVTVGGGTEDQLKTGASYGWQPASALHMRLFADRISRDAGFLPDGDAQDDSRLTRAGFRADWNPSVNDVVLFRTNVYDGTFGSHLPGGGAQDVKHRGHSFTTRWTRTHHAASRTTVQFWYDHLEFDGINLGEDRDTYDLELQHGVLLAGRHNVLLGGGFRRTSDETRPGPVLSLIPAARTNHLSHLFVQDEISLADDAVRLTLGAKVERNDYSGTEWQPNVRIAWLPDADTTWWGAVSRAVRVPSRGESDLGPPMVTVSRFDSEKLVAYETGFRRRMGTRGWLDIALFRNVYDDLLSLEGTVVENRLDGRTAGVEIAGRWLPRPALTLDLSYTFLDMDIDAEPGSTDIGRARLTEGREPQHQVVLRGTWSPLSGFSIDGALRYVDSLAVLDVPSYTVVDLGVRWRPHPDFHVSAAARNLLDSHHAEQAGVTLTEASTQVERGYYLQLDWSLN